ncbi:MAG: hypothetical protein ACRCWO_12770, partial [Bosea sp. (in: a-proteobacteria)]
MPVLLMILGACLVIGGIYGLFEGLPYLVLERGFTQAIMGSVMLTGGLVLIAIGLLMRDMRRLFASLSHKPAITAADTPAAKPAIAGKETATTLAAGTLAAGTLAAGTLAAGAVAAGAVISSDPAKAAGEAEPHAAERAEAGTDAQDIPEQLEDDELAQAGNTEEEAE